MGTVYPSFGYSEKSTDVISNILVTGLITKNKDILNQVMSKFISNPNYDKGSNNVLYYNIACYYASIRDKNKMLGAIKSSIEFGQDASKFLKDADFEAFRNDPDFLTTLELSKQAK